MPHPPTPAGKPSYRTTAIAFALLGAPLAGLLLIAALLLSGGLYFDVADRTHWQWYLAMFAMLWAYSLPIMLLCALLAAYRRWRRNLKGILATTAAGLIITFAFCVVGEFTLGDGYLDPLIPLVSLLGGVTTLLLAFFLPKP